MRAILCGRGKGKGCQVVEFTEQQLEAAHAEHYPEQYQGKLAMTDESIERERQEAAQAKLLLASNPEPPADYWPIARTERSPALVRIPAGSEMVSCKDLTCPVKRLWIVKHPKTGNPTRVACEEMVTLTDGTVVPTGAFPPFLNVEKGAKESLAMDGLGYSHFIDCPSRREFRRK